MTIFVGGIHAVGKTFLVKPACEKLGIRYATASQLIREQRGITNWSVSRQVDDVAENQKALIEALRRLQLNGKEVVLDGHFVLRKNINIHENIDIEIFSQLDIQGVILLEAPDIVIKERLKQRSDTTWELGEIKLFAQKERAHAESVCQKLGIKLMTLNTPDTIEIVNAINNILNDITK